MLKKESSGLETGDREDIYQEKKVPLIVIGSLDLPERSLQQVRRTGIEQTERRLSFRTKARVWIK